MGTNRLIADTTAGKLTIASLSCHISGCWNAFNVEELWTGNAVKGENDDLPYQDGSEALPFRLDEATYLIEMQFSGENDHLGVPWATPWYGIQRNLATFMTTIVNPPSAPTATKPASLLMPDGSTRTASVQPRVMPVKGGGGQFLEGQLTLVVPAGRFA